MGDPDEWLPLIDRLDTEPGLQNGSLRKYDFLVLALRISVSDLSAAAVGNR